MTTASAAAHFFFLFLLFAHSLLLRHDCHAMGSEGVDGGVFDATGPHGVVLATVDDARCAGAGAGGGSPPPPKPLLVAAPRDAGEYPVLLFLHGYLARNAFYSRLLRHVASHGFVAVAPQMYTVSGPDATAEIDAAAAVVAWLAAGGGLAPALPPGVRADAARFALAGHSRGGKVAFALALGYAKAGIAAPLAALVAVDPVDGMGVGRQTPPPILAGGKDGGSNRTAALRVPAPVMVIGTGLGELPLGPLPPCAPRGVSHAAFYEELCAAAAEPGAAPAAACHLVARDYGHTDMMDDHTPGFRGMLARALCRSGGDREPMRRFVGGATVAFLKKWVRGDGAAMDAIRARPETAPVVLSVVEFLEHQVPVP